MCDIPGEEKRRRGTDDGEEPARRSLPRLRLLQLASPRTVYPVLCSTRMTASPHCACARPLATPQGYSPPLATVPGLSKPTRPAPRLRLAAGINATPLNPCLPGEGQRWGDKTSSGEKGCAVERVNLTGCARDVRAVFVYKRNGEPFGLNVNGCLCVEEELWCVL